MSTLEFSGWPYLHTYVYNTTNTVPKWTYEKQQVLQPVARPVTYSVAYERDLLLLLGKDEYDQIVSITELTREELDNLAEQLMDA